MQLVRVALPVPFLGSLAYRVPGGLQVPEPGSRVLAPLGARRLTGIVTGEASRAEVENEGIQAKELIDVLDAGPFLPETILRLAEWVAEYYACGPGEAIAAAMPPFAWVQSELRARLTAAGKARAELGGSKAAAGLTGKATVREQVLRLLGESWLPVRSIAYKLEHERKERKRTVPARAIVRALEADGIAEVQQVLSGRSSAFRTRRVAALTAAGLLAADALARGDSGPPLVGQRQRDALSALAAVPEGVALSSLRERGLAADTVLRLAARGLVSMRTEQVDRDPFATAAMPGRPGDRYRPLEPTPEQRLALARLLELAGKQRFATSLLHGVTGSGKTEVYLRLAESVRALGRSVLILVPEIGLTPALARTVREAFGDQVAIQHSGLSDGERHDQWHRIRRGQVNVVVGTRSAVFAPLSSLGLIVVDEEHDGSYKQEDSPRYHARDVAVMRAKREDALVVLGSATPSLETYRNAESGRYEKLTLARRVFDRPLADVAIVNMREEYADRGPDVVLSRRLSEAIGQRLGRREQVLVLLNRRGYATAVFCRQCGATVDCPNCSVSLTVHAGSRYGRLGRCHYCDHSAPVPPVCPQCAAPYLEQKGFGTERLEREVTAGFPTARVARLDRDAIRRRGGAAELLGRFAAGQIDVLVGTQMIAKGHDFPRVTLVGVVSADVGLGLADFRAAERTFQLLTQVVGRAGRGETAGEAIIQTLFPEHYGIRHACRQDYASFFRDELAFRRAMRYPPFVALTNGIVRAPTLAAAMRDAGEIVQRLREREAGDGFQLLGPAPAPFVKLRGEHRAQFFIKSASRAAMRSAIRKVLSLEPDLRRRLIIDVDPSNVL